MIKIISVYASQIGLYTNRNKWKFCNNGPIIVGTRKQWKIYIRRDLNGHT